MRQRKGPVRIYAPQQPPAAAFAHDGGSSAALAGLWRCRSADRSLLRVHARECGAARATARGRCAPHGDSARAGSYAGIGRRVGGRGPGRSRRTVPSERARAREESSFTTTNSVARILRVVGVVPLRNVPHEHYGDRVDLRKRVLRGRRQRRGFCGEGSPPCSPDAANDASNRARADQHHHGVGSGHVSTFCPEGWGGRERSAAARAAPSGRPPARRREARHAGKAMTARRDSDACWRRRQCRVLSVFTITKRRRVGVAPGGAARTTRRACTRPGRRRRASGKC